MREGLWAAGLMLKQPGPTLHQTTRTEITPRFGPAKLVLDETPKAITPFGGRASCISFLGQSGFAGEVQRRLPFAAPTSNNAIPLAQALTAFLLSVVVGAPLRPLSMAARRSRPAHDVGAGAFSGR